MSKEKLIELARDSIIPLPDHLANQIMGAGEKRWNRLEVKSHCDHPSHIYASGTISGFCLALEMIYQGCLIPDEDEDDEIDGLFFESQGFTDACLRFALYETQPED